MKKAIFSFGWSLLLFRHWGYGMTTPLQDGMAENSSVPVT